MSRPRVSTQTTLFSLYPPSLVQKLKYVNDDKSVTIIKLTRKAKARLSWIEDYKKEKNTAKTYRHFGISRTTFYKWFERYKKVWVRRTAG